MSQGGSGGVEGKLFGWMGDIYSDISMHNHNGNMINQHILHIMGRRMSAEAWAGCRQTRARWNPFALDWYHMQRTTEGRGEEEQNWEYVCVVSIVKVNGSY